MLKRLLFCFFSMLVVGCASVPRPVQVIDPGDRTAPYEAWGKVLDRFVDVEGRINFSALARDRADLDRFVAYVYDHGPNNRPERFPTPAHVLAFHINAYNALAMHKIIETGIPQTLSGLRKIGFFFLGKVQVGGVAISLYDYENKVIRALGDPRIHFALNCMSVGCPRLPREVFTAERLEQQLERETRKFYAESRNVEVIARDAVLRLTEIMKFYPEDFLAKAPTLAAYVNRYRESKVPEEYRVEFIPYDWTVNRQPGS